MSIEWNSLSVGYPRREFPRSIANWNNAQVLLRKSRVQSEENENLPPVSMKSTRSSSPISFLMAATSKTKSSGRYVLTVRLHNRFD